MNARARFPQLAGLAEATAVFLFFYQALRVLFSVLFGLIYDALFDETLPMTVVGLVLVMVILALLSPLASPRQPARRRVARLVSAAIVFLARIPLTPNDPQSRLVASILIVAGAGLYLATRLRDGPRDIVRALILALVADQLLRAVGHTWDVTLRDGWLWGQVIVSLGLCLLAGWLFRQRPAEEEAAGVRPGLLAGLAWGSWLFLETSLLNFPNALARWSDGSPWLYWLAALFLLGLAMPLLLGEDERLTRQAQIGRVLAVLLVILLLIGLALKMLAFQLLAQYLLLLLLPTYFPLSPDDRPGRPGWPLALGGVLFLVWGFAYAFAFTYAYTLDLFRGTGLFILLAAALLAVLPALSRPAAIRPAPRPGKVPAVAIVGAVVLVLLVAILALPRAVRPPIGDVPLRVATYNIHYGYDTDWHLSLEKQAQAIEASGAGVVMLQEVDTGRPTSYMIDDALWLAHRLGMEAVYLPCVEHLTGIALLTRYPVLDSDTLLLPSELEQTGILWAKLDVGGTPVNAFAIWLGLEPEERARQLDAALPFIAAHPGPAAFGGDFNSTPDSPVYARVADAGFVDPFPALGLDSPPTDPAVNPEKRIDFVWLRGLEPLAAQVLDSLASDHRLVVVEATLTE